MRHGDVMAGVTVAGVVRVAVFGDMDMGFSMASAWAQAGHRVTLVVDGLGQVAQASQGGRILATTDPELAVTGAELSVICTTDLDLRPVCRQVGSALGASTAFHTVVLRTPIHAGVTAQVLRPVLQLSSGLRAAGAEFDDACSGGDFGLALWPAPVSGGNGVGHSGPSACPVAFGDPRSGRRLQQLAQGCDLIPRSFAQVEAFCDRLGPGLRGGV
ncbi:MAG: hypothetical protein EBU97_04555, partial [Rhodobacteraceae bacterium]|nr:hypothetical protein [Paracoccaceae bacterium]